MNAPHVQGIPLRPAREALTEMAMSALTRACIAAVATKLDPNVKRADYVRQRWGDEARSVETVLKGTTGPAMTSTSAWAGALSPVTTAFLRNLVPLSAGADLLGRVLGLSFDGANAINLPSIVVALADFCGEGQAIPVVQAVSSIQATLQPYKFAVITVLSREVIEGGNAEQLVRLALLESTAPSLDRRLFDAQPGVANFRPPGLLHNITPLPPASSPGGKTDTMQDDLQALLSAVAPVAGNGETVLVASPAQAVAINLRTVGTIAYRVLVSTQLPPGSVLAIATNAIVAAADAGPAIDTTRDWGNRQ
jgi:hypothetical protein